MSRAFVVFPTHLFSSSVDELIKHDTVYLVQHETSTDVKKRKYISKVKIAYQRATTQYYKGFLLRKGISAVVLDRITDLPKSIKIVHCFDPHDRPLLEQLASMGVTVNTIESPAFIATRDALDEFYKHDKSKKHHAHVQFFAFLKKKLGILSGVKSYDTHNRCKLERGHMLPPEPTRFSNRYYDEAINYTNTNETYKDGLGEAQNVRMYPCTHDDAQARLQYFLVRHFGNFGKYQDAIARDSSFLYHACISAPLNVGLIPPHEVIKSAMVYAEVHGIDMNNVESFVRQILGWRERCRYIYVYFYPELMKHDHWKANRALNWPLWLSGTTGLDVLDTEIKKATSIGYAHHIVRLMVFLNAFVLCRVKFEDVYEWFMACCAIDAYDWVMVSNIASMGFYTQAFMAKPYLASANYYQKMSDYNISKNEKDDWDSLFYTLLNDEKKVLAGGKGRLYLRNLANFERKALESQKRILSAGHVIIARLTRRK